MQSIFSPLSVTSSLMNNHIILFAFISGYKYTIYSNCFIILLNPVKVSFSPSCCCCSVTQLCPTLCDPMGCSTPGFPVLHDLLKLAQSHAHRLSDVIQPSHPLLSPSPPACNLSQHQGLFQWVSSSHQAAKVLELQLQHQSFQWILYHHKSYLKARTVS